MLTLNKESFKGITFASDTYGSIRKIIEEIVRIIYIYRRLTNECAVRCYFEKCGFVRRIWYVFPSASFITWFEITCFLIAGINFKENKLEMRNWNVEVQDWNVLCETVCEIGNKFNWVLC